MTGQLNNFLIMDLLFVAALFPVAVAILQALKWWTKSTTWARRAIRGSLFAPCARYKMMQRTPEPPSSFRGRDYADLGERWSLAYAGSLGATT